MWYSLQNFFINVVQIIKEVLDHTSNKTVDTKYLLQTPLKTFIHEIDLTRSPWPNCIAPLTALYLDQLFQGTELSLPPPSPPELPSTAG